MLNEIQTRASTYSIKDWLSFLLMSVSAGLGWVIGRLGYAIRYQVAAFAEGLERGANPHRRNSE